MKEESKGYTKLVRSIFITFVRRSVLRIPVIWQEDPDGPSMGSSRERKREIQVHAKM
jgi:hypothetical protein